MAPSGRPSDAQLSSGAALPQSVGLACPAPSTRPCFFVLSADSVLRTGSSLACALGRTDCRASGGKETSSGTLEQKTCLRVGVRGTEGQGGGRERDRTSVLQGKQMATLKSLKPLGFH